jgi:hypothetical protein
VRELERNHPLSQTNTLDEAGNETEQTRKNRSSIIDAVMSENGSEGEWKDPPTRQTTVRARTAKLDQHWSQYKDSDESMTRKMPSQGSSKTNISIESFDVVLAYNNEDEDYDDIKSDEVDTYTFDADTLTNTITMEQMIHVTNTKKIWYKLQSTL